MNNLFGIGALIGSLIFFVAACCVGFVHYGYITLSTLINIGIVVTAICILIAVLIKVLENVYDMRR